MSSTIQVILPFAIALSSIAIFHAAAALHIRWADAVVAEDDRGF